MGGGPPTMPPLIRTTYNRWRGGPRPPAPPMGPSPHTTEVPAPTEPPQPSSMETMARVTRELGGPALGAQTQPITNGVGYGGQVTQGGPDLTKP